MKRIKKLLFVFLLMGICSGCTIKYDLEIKENEVVEKITAYDEIMDGRTSSDILNTYNSWMPVYDNIDNPDLIQDSDDNDGKIAGIEYHNKSNVETEDGYKLNYSYIYPINDFNHANSMKLAFGSPNFYNASNYINIRTNNVNTFCNYDYFESLQVNIKVDLNIYRVKQSNAHSVKGSVYTWNLNRSNCSRSVISLTLDKINGTVVNTTTANKDTNGNNNKKRNNWLDSYVLYIFLVIMILIIIFGYRWFNQMKERDNRVD